MHWRRFTKMQTRGVTAAILVSLLGAGFSAQAVDPVAIRAPTPPAIGYEAQDHFPGAAMFTAMDDADYAATLPFGGATGTIALPDSPVPNVGVGATIQPAKAFHLAGSGADKARALQCLTTAIYYEAASEPDAGQRAVAQVVLNRVRHPAFPSTICGVVFQGSDKSVCQFSFACDGALNRGVPSVSAWNRAARTAAAALSGGVFGPVGMATHYHTYAVTPAWNRSLVMTGVYGAHFFHRWKGYWGTPAAFTSAYHGNEPFPGPIKEANARANRDAAADTTLLTAAPPAAALTPAKGGNGTPPPAATVQPGYAASGAYVENNANDSDSQILDKWKDSGKPIR